MKTAPESPSDVLDGMLPFQTRAEASQYLSDVFFAFVKSVHAEGGRRAEIIEAACAAGRPVRKAA